MRKICAGCSHPTICRVQGCGAAEARQNKMKKVLDAVVAAFQRRPPDFPATIPDNRPRLNVRADVVDGQPAVVISIQNAS